MADLSPQEPLSGSGGPFSNLDDLLLVTLSLYFDASSLVNTLQSCRFWRDLERNSRHPMWRSRLFSQYGPLRLSAQRLTARLEDHGENSSPGYLMDLGDAWRELAIRLHSGKMDCVGSAIDAFTSGFEPYQMRLYMHRTHPVAGEGWVRWPTLRNSATKLGNLRLCRSDDSDLFERIEFSEVQLIEGSFILIPNHYCGYICGPSIVGVYPNGAFFLLLEEAASTSLRRSLSACGAPSDASGCEISTTTESEANCSNDTGRVPTEDFDTDGHKLILRSGSSFLGLLVVEPIGFDAQQIERQPNPYCAVAELDVAGRLDTEKVRDVVKSCGMPHLAFHNTKTGFCGHLHLRCGESSVGGSTSEVQEYMFTVVIVNVRCQNPNEYDAIIFITSLSVQVTAGLGGKELQRAFKDANPNEDSQHHFAAKLLNGGGRLYAWFHGDSMIGILKNDNNQAGSFNLQLRRRNQLSALGLRRVVAAGL